MNVDIVVVVKVTSALYPVGMYFSRRISHHFRTMAEAFPADLL